MRRHGLNSPGTQKKYADTTRGGPYRTTVTPGVCLSLSHTHEHSGYLGRGHPAVRGYLTGGSPTGLVLPPLGQKTEGLGLQPLPRPSSRNSCGET